MGWLDSESTTQRKLPYYARGKVPQVADATHNIFNVDGEKGLSQGDFRLWARELAPDLNEQQLQGLREALTYGFDDAGIDHAKKTLYSQIKNPEGPQYNRFTPNKHEASKFRLVDAFDPNTGAYTPEAVDWTQVSGPEAFDADPSAWTLESPGVFDADPSAWALEAPGVTTGGAYDIGDTDTFLQNAFDAMSRQVGQAVDTKFAQAGRSGATSARTADFGTRLFDAYAPMALSEAARRQQLGFDAYEAAENRGLTAQDLGFNQDLEAAQFAFDTTFQPWQAEQALQLEAAELAFDTAFQPWQTEQQLRQQADLANQATEADLGKFLESQRMADAQFDTEQERAAYEEYARRVVERDQNRADEKFRTKEANITNSEEAFQNWVQNDLAAFVAGGDMAQSAIGLLDELGAEERAKIESILGVGDALYQQEVAQNMAPLEMIEIYNNLLRQTDWGNGPVTTTSSPSAFDLVNKGVRAAAGVAGAV